MCLHLENSTVGNVSAAGVPHSLTLDPRRHALRRGGQDRATWAASSSGRAPVLRTGGTGFEPPVVHPTGCRVRVSAPGPGPGGRGSSPCFPTSVGGHGKFAVRGHVPGAHVAGQRDVP